MAHSYRKTPILGICGRKDCGVAEWKRQRARKLRRANEVKAHIAARMVDLEEVSFLYDRPDAWDRPDDGKRYWDKAPAKYLRK